MATTITSRRANSYRIAEILPFHWPPKNGSAFLRAESLKKKS